MRRRRMWYLVAMAGGLAVTSLFILTLVVKHSPAFYHRGEVAAGSARGQLAQEFLNRASDLFSRIGEGPTWSQEFSQEQINSYFQDELFQATRLIEIPDHVQAPRVALEEDRIRIAFRYGSGWFSTVISIDLRVWLAAKEPNVVALELCGFWAGGLPLGTRSLLDYISEAAREQSIDVTWYRHGPHPIGLLRLQANQARPTFQLRRFEAMPGKLVFSGKNLTDPPPAPPPAPATAAAR